MHAIRGVPGLSAEGGTSSPIVRVENTHAVARVALHGAQVLTYVPRGSNPILWLSPRAVFSPGRAVRGGVPICWPWFGPHPTDETKPNHGFARLSVWALDAAWTTEDGGHKMMFRFPMEAGAAAGWKQSFDLRLTVSVGPVLELALTTRNTGDSPLTVGGALHGYFAVSDIRKVRVSGLEGRAFVDQRNPAERRVQKGPVEIGAETDRVYDDPGNRCVIEDPLLARRIVVEKSGSRSTVLWNPWLEKARAFSDVGEDQYRDFLCVEPAYVLSDVVTLAPGEGHCLTASIHAEPM